MADPLRAQFGRLSRETRTMLDISQSDLARAAGVSRSFLAEIEAGRGNPTFDTAMRIGEALGLDLVLLGARQC